MKLSKKLFGLMMLVGIIVASITFVAPIKAQGGTVVLNPTDDAYINYLSINSNYGSDTRLKVQLGDYTTWLKFDLSSIPELAIGITAVLELYTAYNGVTEPHPMVACLILNDFNNSWSEDTITANNCPPWPDDVELGAWAYVANDETWYEWAVTEAVVNATANNVTAVTILMRHPWGVQPAAVYFNSKEASLTKIPKLTVNWADIIPEFPSFLILPLFMIATLVVVIVYKRTRQRTQYVESERKAKA